MQNLYRLSTICLFVLAAGWLNPAASQTDPFTLTVLHNNDGESQLLNAPGQPDFGGAARFKTLVDQLRTEAGDAVVMLSSGDNFLAGPEFNVSLDLPGDQSLFESRALDLIGYDALAIGNHEFDFGPDVLERLISDFDAPTPFLSANLDFSAETGLQTLVDDGRIAKSTLVEKDGQMIGIIGATTPNLPFISSPRDVVVMENVAELVQAEIDAFTAMGVDKIILISHLQGIEEDQELVAMLSGIDIAIAGGGDELLANDDDALVPGDESEVFGGYPLIAQNADGVDVPVVTTAGNYKYVGRLVVDFDENGLVTAIDEISGPVRVAGGAEADAVEEDATVLAEVTEPVAAALEALAANVIGQSEVALDGVRGNIRSVETNLGNLIADAFLWQATELADAFGVPAPDVAFSNGGGIRNDNLIPAGDITELTTFDILPFSNFLTVLPEIPANQFKEILENAVSALGGGSGTGRFAQIGGMKMVIDETATAQVLDDDGNVTTPGERVLSAVLDDGRVVVENGAVVAGADPVNVATVDFLANGGDQYPFRGAPFTSLGVTYQQVLADYIADGLGGAITAADYPEGGEGRIVQSGGVVSSVFSLVNADTDQVLLDIVDGSTLELSPLPTRNLNVVAIFAAADIKRVQFDLNGTTVRTEHFAPYALFGDASGDYIAGRLPVGSHVLTATALDTDGNAITIESVSFDVTDGNALGIAELVLVDASTNSDIGPLADGASIDLSQLPAELNVRAEVTGEVGSVVFSLNDDTYHRTEHFAPYALFGDLEGDYLSGSFEAGENTLSVTPFGESMGDGDVGETLTIVFNVEGGSAGKQGASKGRFVEPLVGLTEAEMPEKFALQGNYPNPFNPATTIAFSLPEQSEIQLTVFDILGRQVSLIHQGTLQAGQHELRFDAGNIPSGTYFYRLVTPAGTFVKQMVLLK